jgi:hypothetical protein
MEFESYLALGLGTEGGGRSFGLPPSDFDELCLLDIMRVRLGGLEELMAVMRLRVARPPIDPRVQTVAQLNDNLYPTSFMEQ